jgi:hypothetical protein
MKNLVSTHRFYDLEPLLTIISANRSQPALCRTRMGPVSANDFHPGVTIVIDGD